MMELLCPTELQLYQISISFECVSYQNTDTRYRQFVLQIIPDIYPPV